MFCISFPASLIMWSTKLCNYVPDAGKAGIRLCLRAWSRENHDFVPPPPHSPIDIPSLLRSHLCMLILSQKLLFLGKPVCCLWDTERQIYPMPWGRVEKKRKPFQVLCEKPKVILVAPHFRRLLPSEIDIWRVEMGACHPAPHVANRSNRQLFS